MDGQVVFGLRRVGHNITAITHLEPSAYLNILRMTKFGDNRKRLGLGKHSILFPYFPV
jgi:hypothetical protein